MPWHAAFVPYTLGLLACMRLLGHSTSSTVVQDLCASGAGTSEASAAHTLWGAVSKTEMGQAVETGGDVEAALHEVLCGQAPSCRGDNMQASGQLHGYQVGDQRHLLLTAVDEEWKDAARDVCMGHLAMEDATHSFTAPGQLAWDVTTGIGTVKVPDGAANVQGGVLDVQVARSTVPKQPEVEQVGPDDAWMWELLWAETLDKSSMHV